MKTSKFKKLLAVFVLLFVVSLANAQTPPINGCNCTNGCGTAPNGGYDFTNFLGCSINIKYTLVDVSTGVVCTSGTMPVAAGGVVCLFSCTDFNTCGGASGPWDIIVTLLDINGNTVPASSSTINHSGTSSIGPNPSPDPCTPNYSMSNGGCGAQVF